MTTFNSVPTIYARRSVQDLGHKVYTTMNVGDVVPIDVQEVYPGDDFPYKCHGTLRLTSSYIRVPLDNVYLDTMFFFVPDRLVVDGFEQIFGQNDSGEWVQSQSKDAPFYGQGSGTTTPPTVYSGTVADYLGMPLGKIPTGFNMIPFRGFAKIYNDWLRDENLTPPVHIQKGDWSSTAEALNNNAWSPNNYTGKLPKASKFHDLFTSCLPNTQAGEAVKLPISDFAPVIGTNTYHGIEDGYQFKFSTSTTAASMGLYGKKLTTPANTYKMTGNTDAPAGGNNEIGNTNIYADLRNTGLQDISVNDLRYSFALQRILERAARGGQRYTEYLASAFNVQSPDARLQRAEFLGGSRQLLNIQQVAQTTRGDDDAATLGSLGAFSLSNTSAKFFKGFAEHGFVYTIGILRYKHSYAQGIEKFWQRHSRYDYYDPALSNIAEQPVYTTEIWNDSQVGATTLKGSVFGYNEAWIDLRYRPNRISGQMRPSVQIGGAPSHPSLDIWHFGDEYSTAPTLNQQFIEETPLPVDRAIAVPSTSQHQFLCEFTIDCKAARRLPVRSIPGLLDHN